MELSIIGQNHGESSSTKLHYTLFKATLKFSLHRKTNEWIRHKSKRSLSSSKSRSTTDFTTVAGGGWNVSYSKCVLFQSRDSSLQSVVLFKMKVYWLVGRPFRVSVSCVIVHVFSNHLQDIAKHCIHT